MKSTLMLAALAAVFAAGVACSFGVWSPSSSSSCDGLTGQAKIDCEKKQPQ